MNLSNEHVMVVDDDLMILEILTQQLESFGVGSVLALESADEALTVTAEDPKYSVLLTDLSMPKMDGPRFLRQLAAQNCRARIVLISGARNDILQSTGELGRSLGLNMAGFIHKPVMPEALRELIELTATTDDPHPAHPPPAQPGARAQSSPDLSPKQLHDALASRTIRPWYQPKVDAQSLRLVGLEALARWTTPDGNVIAPAIFVPAIESAGMSLELFYTMLEQVLADMQRWKAKYGSIKVSVNLSMDCTHALDLPEQIERRLSAAGIAADQLVIEVTETRLMGDRAASMETLTRLSLMGITLSIDDFGTGYSSLAQLADLPFGELKVDAHFVRRAGLDPKADTILQTTVTFGRGLGMQVVAEGVEHFSQLDTLRTFGPQAIQGFLIARPMPATLFERWLVDWRPGTEHGTLCHRPPNVLIADDSAAMRAVIEAELKARLPAAQFVQAENGEVALALSKTMHIDMATLDFLMPGLDGLELLRRLRDRAPAARFVLLTAHLSDDVARECVALGAMYCPKPLTDVQADRITRHFMYD